MPKYLTITEAQQQLPNWPDDLVTEPAIVTKDGKPAIVALSFKQFESLLETIEILSDSEFMKQLRSGIEQAQKGETIDLQQLKSRVKPLTSIKNGACRISSYFDCASTTTFF
ncbi:MAG: type II toxin-antitoxin system Phd/YefM family antitoxin [Oscillatoriales cyanobacterium RU_3_3]|nr:type II toxin-antitoxin system Phd/YefM family antitoxin [Oscillatoriales cyanobacterium RU_3_3]